MLSFFTTSYVYLYLQGQQQRCRAAPADRAELSHRRHRRRARRRPASFRPASAHVPVLVLKQEEGHHRRRQEHGKLRLKCGEGMMRIPLPNRGVTTPLLTESVFTIRIKITTHVMMPEL